MASQIFSFFFACHFLYTAIQLPYEFYDHFDMNKG